MNRVHPRISIGDQSSCQRGTEDLLVVHACKIPCHQYIVGYTKTLPKDHPYYLSYRDPWDLYLNLIDPPMPLFMEESFRIFLDAVDWWKGEILIHCNEGLSRAPSLALLAM